MKVLLCALLLVGATAALSPLSAQQPGFKEYYNPKLHFRFTYPESWTMDDVKRGDAYIRILAPQEAGSSFRNAIEVTRQTMPAGKTLEAWSTSETESLKKVYPTLTLIGGGPTMVQGKEAYMANYAADVKGTKATITRIYSQDKGLLFTSTLVAESGKLETLMPVLQNAISTLKAQ